VEERRSAKDAIFERRRGLTANAAFASSTRWLEQGELTGHDCDFSWRTDTIFSLLIILLPPFPSKLSQHGGFGKETPSVPGHHRAVDAPAGPMLSVGSNAAKNGGGRAQFSNGGKLF
jgi:hypothetical protein